MTRLEHRVDTRAAPSARLRSDRQERPYGGLAVSVARHFDYSTGSMRWGRPGSVNCRANRNPRRRHRVCAVWSAAQSEQGVKG
jgi:hypothetical protein